MDSLRANTMPPPRVSSTHVSSVGIVAPPADPEPKSSEIRLDGASSSDEEPCAPSEEG